MLVFIADSLNLNILIIFEKDDSMYCEVHVCPFFSESASVDGVCSTYKLLSSKITTHASTYTQVHGYPP